MNFKGTVKEFAEANGIEPGTAQQVLSFLCDKGFARVIGEAPKALKQKGRASKIYEALDMSPIGKFDPNIKDFVKKDKDDKDDPTDPTPTAPKVLSDPDNDDLDCENNPRVSQTIVAPTNPTNPRPIRPNPPVQATQQVKSVVGLPTTKPLWIH